MVLQNGMDLLKGELGSSSKTCVTSKRDGNPVTGVEAEWVTNIKEEEDQEPMTIREIKTEPKVSVVPVVNICTFVIGCIQNGLPLCQCVAVKQNFKVFVPCIFSTYEMKNQQMSLFQFYSYIDGSLHVSGPQAHAQENSHSCSHNHWFSGCTVRAACSVCCGRCEQSPRPATTYRARGLNGTDPEPMVV
jgi:hypothetical protein